MRFFEHEGTLLLEFRSKKHPQPLSMVGVHRRTLVVAFCSILVAHALWACGQSSNPVPTVTELPDSFYEDDAREVLMQEIREQCHSLGITRWLTSALRQAEVAPATRTQSHWALQMVTDGRPFRPYLRIRGGPRRLVAAFGQCL